MHRRSLVSLFAALGLAASFSACKKKDDGSGSGASGSGKAGSSEIVVTMAP
jgi:hypothetical protein